MDKSVFSFKEHTKHKIGTITYDITAHFNDDKETLKSKIITLLINNTPKHVKTFASSHNNSV